MHGIQHLFRQHALEKQSSTESWHSAYAGGGGSTQGSLSSQGNFAFSRPPNERSHSVDEAGSTYDSSGDSRNGTNPQLDFGAMRSPASQEYHIPETSTPRSKKSPDGRASLDFGRSGLKMLSKRNITGRRSSLESAGSPPMYNNAGFFPHDLDDIYEYKTDHQYFTHTGGYDEPDRSALSSDYHRNMLFQRNHAFHSLDEYANAANHTLGFNRYQYDRYLGHRNRFDNSSFAGSLPRASPRVASIAVAICRYRRAPRRSTPSSESPQESPSSFDNGNAEEFGQEGPYLARTDAPSVN
nr:uncharacterized protein LOC109398791 [Aedes albopictus]XP_029733845.1 uncharacterized protein LOC109398791 [Aedes albopictus]XP_029733846.1 uncharacterized protein LOC109398791 [Aedes albopictus]XP_029733847.1 uncharacterized protein LOC109398791 [Aedes albopictus]XP_029733848.1 uncharacterized protein LOC109398791 [Aedes albopictus]XP_029733849.1 uncharacterized protein LOC109398791 [Aedes albopictus]XP_029733850.1 uncharacterized protein LOC109398791 [Aedes albopictus]XP_029733851.1 unc